MTLEPRVKSTMASIRITVLVENTAAGDLLGEHGLAFWIETPVGAAILDTDQVNRCRTTPPVLAPTCHASRLSLSATATMTTQPAWRRRWRRRSGPLPASTRRQRATGAGRPRHV